MTSLAGNKGDQYALKTGKNERLLLLASIPIGATGAVGTIDGDDGGISAVRNSAGNYSVTFPTALKGRVATLEVVSAARTIASCTVVAWDPTTGVLNFTTDNAAQTATDPANGDTIHVGVYLDVRG